MLNLFKILFNVWNYIYFSVYKIYVYSFRENNFGIMYMCNFVNMY